MKKIEHNLLNQTFTYLTVISSAPNREHKNAQHRTFWFCRCRCGKELEVSQRNLIYNDVRSCGCLQKERRKEYIETVVKLRPKKPYSPDRSRRVHQLEGKIFGRLLIIKEVADNFYFCKCLCGNEYFTKRNNFFRKPQPTRSCGCLIKEHAASIAHLGGAGGKNKHKPGLQKEKHYNWKGGVCLNRSVRETFKYKNWRFEIFKRDKFKCQRCGTAKQLHAHHIKYFSILLKENQIQSIEEAENCEALWDLSNGITLCIPCHEKEHNVPIKTSRNSQVSAPT